MSESQVPSQYYNHPKWGIGQLVGADESSIHLVFLEQGFKRIATMFLPRLSPAAPDPALAAALAERSASEVEERAVAMSGKTRAEPKKITHRGLRAIETLEGQVAFFEKHFPKGFEDPLWVETQRGAPDKEGSLEWGMAQAQEILTKAALAECAEADGEGTYDLIKRVLKVARPHVQSQDVGRVSGLVKIASHEPAFNRALTEYLYGTSSLSVRFETFVRSLVGGTSRWPTATIFGAFVHPNDHAFVKPLYIRKQAEIVATTIGYKTKPSGSTYVRIVGAARNLRDRLQEMGHTPRDNMEAYAFSWVTLARAARIKGEKLEDPPEPLVPPAD